MVSNWSARIIEGWLIEVALYTAQVQGNLNHSSKRLLPLFCFDPVNSGNSVWNMSDIVKSISNWILTKELALLQCIHCILILFSVNDCLPLNNYMYCNLLFNTCIMGNSVFTSKIYLFLQEYISSFESNFCSHLMIKNVRVMLVYPFEISVCSCN